MSWSKRHYPIVPKYGTALAGLAALVALSPLSLVTQQRRKRRRRRELPRRRHPDRPDHGRAHH